MRKRVWTSAVLVVAGLFAGQVGAQFGPPDLSQLSPEEQQAVQDMREMGTTIFQRMQDKGINMQEWGQNLMQQMQDGSFDPAAFQQKMIDDGILDEGMVTKMQKTGQSAAMGNIRRQLIVTDEEWAVLLPKVEKVVAAMSDVGVLTQGQPGGAGMMMGGPAPSMDINKAAKKLKDALKDPGSTPATIKECLEGYREIRDLAKKRLSTARDDLQGVATIRQEAILMKIGILI